MSQDKLREALETIQCAAKAQTAFSGMSWQQVDELITQALAASKPKPQAQVTEPSSERAELKPLRCISGANGSSDYCGFCGANMCFIPPICPERVRRALKEIPREDVQAYGCSWEAFYPQEPDSRCEKWCGRPECPVTLTPNSKHHILGVTTDKKRAALLSTDDLHGTR